MNIDTLFAVILVTTAFTTLLAVMLIFLRNTREAEYNRDRQRVEMEKLRESFELQLRDLTYRLLSTEGRWKDAHQLQLSAQDAVDIQHDDFEIQLSEFFKNIGVSKENIRIDKTLVFVLTPFNKEETETFEAIKQVCSRVGLKCLRGDEEYIKTGDILSHILNNLVKARIVIANINGRNPNVFYELGISHAIAKPTILVGKSLSEAPFDIQSKRIILYENLQQLESRLTEELTRTLINI